MIGEIMKTKLSLAALLAGGMMVATSGSASAADLGGDCCADLEERVATLEATTARKGNRKVSLKISGWVNQSLTYWDNGEESDTYIATPTEAVTRFRFAGGAKINHNWSAGYLIELQVFNVATSQFTEDNDDGPAGSGIGLRKSELWIKNKQLGKISLGQGSSATDDMAFWGQVGITALVFQPDLYTASNVALRRNDGTASTITSRALVVGNGWDQPRNNRVRYDTPTISGFTLSASWGEDDFSDVALRYAGTLGDFKAKAAIGYTWDDDDNAVAAGETNALIISAGIMHTPTGLFLHGMYADYSFDGVRVDSDSWMVQAGIQQRWNELGKTTLFGAYQEADDGLATLVAGQSSKQERLSFGIIQDIDAAAMKISLVYEHLENEVSTEALGLQDIDTIRVTGVILF